MRALYRPVSLALLALAVGCASGDSNDGAGADASAPVTFSNQVSRLLQEHCQSCHRPDSIGPFPLLTYEDAAPIAPLIKQAVVSRRMPHGVSMRLDTGCAEADTFRGPRRLTQEEIDTFAAWADGGAPEGDPADMPPPRQFPTGEWTGGDPDFQFVNAEDGFNLPPGLGRDVFRRFVIATDFDRDRYITGFEAIPGSTGGTGLTHVVHHVTLFIDPERSAIQQEQDFAASDPEVTGPGFEGDFRVPTPLVGMWFPGSGPLTLPEGTGVLVPRGAALVIEVHYSSTDEPVVDRTRVGLQLEDQVARRLEVSLVKNEEFTVPAGMPDFQVTATRAFDSEFELVAITPHMHQVGTDFRVVIEPPAGSEICLADVEWDFEHQGTYWLTQPMRMPAGTTIHTECRYDNSADNPNQFNDPPADIEWGREADHEMCQLTVALVAAAAPDPDPDPDPGQVRLAEVYYDAPGEDDGLEWIRLYNPGGSAVDLSSYSLGWGGTDYTYGTLSLSGTLPAGACTVVGAVPEGGSGQSATFTPNLQNSGTAADGIGLFLGAPGPDSVPVDAVLYGAENSSGLLDETGTPGAVDVADAPSGSSIQRAGDTWSVQATPAPLACP